MLLITLWAGLAWAQADLLIRTRDGRKHASDIKRVWTEMLARGTWPGFARVPAIYSAYLTMTNNRTRQPTDQEINDFWDLHLAGRADVQALPTNRWPWGRQERDQYLIVHVTDATLGDTMTWVAPVKDPETHAIIQERAYRVDYRAQRGGLGLSNADVTTLEDEQATRETRDDVLRRVNTPTRAVVTAK
jgi:hypothetical protein